MGGAFKADASKMTLTAASTSALLCLVFVATILPSADSVEIPNGVEGLPEVECKDDGVTLTFRTEAAFTGKIFVKGLAGQGACSRNFATNTESRAVFEVAEGTCNMRRTRRLGPSNRGVEQSMTVIISFHDTFITKVDRAFRCTCFFMEAEKVVTSRFDVSMLPTTDLVDTARMPLCTYNVRRGSISGETVQFARVGEEVYHVWECESDQYGMLVHSCFVDDGVGGARFELLDSNGCSIDTAIMEDLTYNQQSNMAYVEAHVAKFPDKSTTYFQCAVSVCIKADGGCLGSTPPKCRARPLGPADGSARSGLGVLSSGIESELFGLPAEQAPPHFSRATHRPFVDADSNTTRPRPIRIAGGTTPRLLTAGRRRLRRRQRRDDGQRRLVKLPAAEFNEFDLSAAPIMVLELDEDAALFPEAAGEWDSTSAEAQADRRQEQKICLSAGVVSLAAAGLLLMLTLGVVSALLLVVCSCRAKTRPAKQR